MKGVTHSLFHFPLSWLFSLQRLGTSSFKRVSAFTRFHVDGFIPNAQLSMDIHDLLFVSQVCHFVIPNFRWLPSKDVSVKPSIHYSLLSVYDNSLFRIYLAMFFLRVFSLLLSCNFIRHVD